VPIRPRRTSALELQPKANVMVVGDDTDNLERRLGRSLTCTNLPIVLALPNCWRDSRLFSTRTPSRALVSRSVKVRLSTRRMLSASKYPSVTYAKFAMSAVIAPTGLADVPLGYPLLVQHRRCQPQRFPSSAAVQEPIAR
jgi:hypothetical protein